MKTPSAPCTPISVVMFGCCIGYPPLLLPGSRYMITMPVCAWRGQLCPAGRDVTTEGVVPGASVSPSVTTETKYRAPAREQMQLV